jgi:hypothetical protein
MFFLPGPSPASVPPPYCRSVFCFQLMISLLPAVCQGTPAWFHSRERWPDSDFLLAAPARSSTAVTAGLDFGLSLLGVCPVAGVLCSVFDYLQFAPPNLFLLAHGSGSCLARWFPERAYAFWILPLCRDFPIAHWILRHCKVSVRRPRVIGVRGGSSVLPVVC